MGKSNIIKKAVALVMTIILFTGSLTAFAESGFFLPYTPYEYNMYDESVPVPAGYVPYKEIFADDLGLDNSFDSLSDCVYHKGFLYILDSGRNRILKLNQQLTLETVYTDFTIPEELSEWGEPEVVNLKGAQGLCITDEGNIIIADTENERLLICSENKVIKIIKKPESNLLDQEVPFRVTKVTIGSQGKIYALVESVNKGALVFSPEGEFISFFGSNTVKQTSEVLMKYLKRRFMTSEQLASMKSYTPVNISNFDINKRGFMVTVAQDTSEVLPPAMVRRLNYKGTDVLNSGKTLYFGDIEWDRDPKKNNITRFIDVDIDAEGYYFLLDSQRGKVFLYSNTGELISVFGTLGLSKGTMKNPTAIETLGDKVLVLDSGKKCIHVFKPTDYVLKYRKALLSLENQNYQQSLEEWQQLLNENTNNEFVYYGIGKLYDSQKNYSTAMTYFKKANNKEAYSHSYREYRKEYVRDNFLKIIFSVIGIVVIFVVGVRLIRRKTKAVGDGAYTVMESKWLFPLYTLKHPVDGFDQFKTRKIRSSSLTSAIIVLWFLLMVAQYFLTGYIFNQNRAKDFNLFITLAQTIGIFILFTVSNWAVTTLMQGKGKLGEICSVTAYSLLPYLFSVIAFIVCSNFFTAEEQSFLSLILIIGQLWTFMLLFLGLYSIHQYSVTKTLISLVVTLIGMAVMIFLLILFYTLITQTISFVRAIVQEISLR